MEKANFEKVLGFDFGMKYIGVASGQTITKSATPIGTIKAKDGIPNWDEIADLITKWEAKAIVVGVPLNMDGTEQAITFCARKFANRLREKCNLPIYTVDERLSTWEAKNRLGIHYKKENIKKQELEKINATSAAILVEQWMNTI